MSVESLVLETQLQWLKKTYEEHQLIAQRYRVEYERTKRRLAEFPPSCGIGAEPECDT